MYLLELAMKKLDAAGRGWLYVVAVFFLTGIVPWLLYAQTPSPELIVDICATPHRYWNKYVMLKGHVRTVTANPPGTNRGSYVLRDSSDVDITILTSDLPAQGKEYTVYGNVEQTSPDSKVPVIREFRRASGSEPPPHQEARPRRPAPSEESEYEPAPVKRRVAPQVSQPAPAPQPAPVTKEVAPTVIPSTPAAKTTGTSMNLIIGIVGLAALIVIVVVVMVMRPKKPAPAPASSYARPVTTAAPPPIRPPAPPPPTSGRTVNAAPRSAATQVVPPPAPKATEVYFDLGMELAVTDGPDRGKRFPITKLSITLGRSGARQNDVTLSDGTVSREHAKIIYASAEKTFRLINESTTNPARLNGNPIDAAVIKEGDIIQIGSSIMKFSKKS
jgi:hypothetical protein